MHGLGARLRLSFASPPFLTSFILFLCLFVFPDTGCKPVGRSNVNASDIGIVMVVNDMNINSRSIADPLILYLELFQSLEAKVSRLD